MNFANKSDLIEFIKNQLGITLANFENCFVGGYSRLLYTEIPKEHQNAVFSLLDKNGIRHESHHGDRYWIFLLNERTEKR